MLGIGLNTQIGSMNTAQSTLLNGLFAYYKLDETSGSRIDSYTNSLDLTEVNTVASATGVIGNSASFVAANNEYLQLGSSAFNFANSYSISAWVKARSWPNIAAVVSHWNATSNQRRYALQIWNDRINFFHVDSSGTEQLLQRLITNNTTTWYHLVAVYDHENQEMRLYRNNVLMSSRSLTTGTTSNTGATFRVGALLNATFNADADIDEVGIWARAISGTEVGQIFNSGMGKTFPFDIASVGVGGFSSGFDSGFGP